MALFDKDNMLIYEAGRSVPPEAQKAASNGNFSFTDINPMWRIKKLTEMFGMAGIGWYTEILSERSETYGDTVMAIVDINLYVKVGDEWSKPIFGTGGNLLVQATKSGAKPSDEGYKKAYTDALSIACKAIGIGADIWYSKDPTSKYSDKWQEVNAIPVIPAAQMDDLVCETCQNPIQDIKKKDGSTWFASDIAAYTKKRYGRMLCGKCALEAKKAAV